MIGMRCLASLLSCSHLSALLCTGIVACGSDDKSTTDPVTYHADVRPLIDAYCVRCHVKGGLAPFALDTESQVLKFKVQIVESVESEYMPLVDDCPDFDGAFALSKAQRDVFTRWQDDDFEIGDEADFAPLSRRCATPPDKLP